MAVDLEVAEARARRAYEIARLRRGLLHAMPLGAVVFAVALGGYRAGATFPLGALLYASAVLFLWRGQQLGEGVFPGAIAGLVPLTLAFCAKSYGHVCTGSACVSLCVPACVLGGMLAGSVITFVARRRSAPDSSRTTFFLAASAVALLTGALGCSCVGFGGVIGLFGGLAVPFLAQLAHGFRRRLT